VLPRVLLVEDDWRAHQLLRQILVSAGYDVVSAMTQAEGLERIHESLDCVILDLRLPDGDGEAILRRIRFEGLTMRVAVTTAETDPARLRGVADLDADFILRKPIDPQRLVAWLERLGSPVRRTVQTIGSVN
jgi:DNA-binding response OmpR family regulator